MHCNYCTGVNKHEAYYLCVDYSVFDILLAKNKHCEPYNSIGNRRHRTPTLSGGAPLLCLQSRKDVSCSLMSLSIPSRYKLSCAKIFFLMPARNYKAQSDLAIKIENYIEQ